MCLTNSSLYAHISKSLRIKPNIRNGENGPELGAESHTVTMLGWQWAAILQRASRQARLLVVRAFCSRFKLILGVLHIKMYSYRKPYMVIRFNDVPTDMHYICLHASKR